MEAFLIMAMKKREENHGIDQIRLMEHLAPSRVGGVARRVRTAYRLFWAIPPTTSDNDLRLVCPFVRIEEVDVFGRSKTQTLCFSEGINPQVASQRFMNVFWIQRDPRSIIFLQCCRVNF